VSCADWIDEIDFRFIGAFKLLKMLEVITLKNW